jgi:hypothetical protein
MTDIDNGRQSPEEPAWEPDDRPVAPPFVRPRECGGAQRSPWEQAHEVWQDSGVSWEQPAGPEDEPDAWGPPQDDGWVPQRDDRWVPPRDAGWVARYEQNYGWAPREEGGWTQQGRHTVQPPDFTAQPPRAQYAPAATPLGAPTMADSVPAAGYVYQQPDHRSDQEDEPWVVKPVRRSPLRVLRIVIPLVLIAAVGGGAVVMLRGSGRTPAVLAGHTSNPPAKVKAKANTTSMTPIMNMAMFPAPGAAPKTVAVIALATNGTGTQVAAGTAGGQSAIWERTGAGPWKLVDRAPQGELGTVTYGGDHGWLATGATPGGPLVMTSPDGITWHVVTTEHSFVRYTGVHIFGGAAGRTGYIVVGLVIEHGRPLAADWWSMNQKYWFRAGNGGLDGRYSTSQMRAATATPGGFVVVGQHALKPCAWMAGSGHDWMLMDLQIPAGATSAILTQAAANGDQVVALGDATTSHGLIPFAAVSPDGGASWTETPITAAPATVVTAVTHTAAGYVAAGIMGTTAVYWTSADGTHWSPPQAAGHGITALTGLAPDGDQAAGIGVMMGRPTQWSVRG